MNQQTIINDLIINRKNDLTVKRIEVVFDKQSLGNPKISVGTLPYYEWNTDKEMTYVITYGRYLNCEMLVYDKQIKADKDFIIVKGQDKAIKALTKILTGIKVN